MVVQINTGIFVTSNYPFCMFVCGREDTGGYGCGKQLAYCSDDEFMLRGKYFLCEKYNGCVRMKN